MCRGPVHFFSFFIVADFIPVIFCEREGDAGGEFAGELVVGRGGAVI